MSRFTNHFVQDASGGHISLPTPNQRIVRIINSEGDHRHQVLAPDGTRFLVSLPVHFGNVLVERGSYLLLESIEEDDEVQARIVRFLTSEDIAYFKEQKVWPQEFDDKDTEYAHDCLYLFHNPTSLDSTATNESTESADSDDMQMTDLHQRKFYYRKKLKANKDDLFNNNTTVQYISDSDERTETADSDDMQMTDLYPRKLYYRKKLRVKKGDLFKNKKVWDYSDSDESTESADSGDMQMIDLHPGKLYYRKKFKVDQGDLLNNTNVCKTSDSDERTESADSDTQMNDISPQKCNDEEEDTINDEDWFIYMDVWESSDTDQSFKSDVSDI